MKKNITDIFSKDSPTVRNLSIATVAFAAFFIGLLWAGIVLEVNNERQVAINEAIKDTSNLARAFEEHTLRTIQSADQMVLLLKYQTEHDAGNFLVTPDQEGQVLWTQPFALLSISDENGDLKFSNKRPLMLSNIKGEEYFEIHASSDGEHLFISVPVIESASGKWSIQMTRRINKLDGSFGGVAIVSVDPYYFTDFYRQVDLGSKSAITLVGRDGIILARRSGGVSSLGEDLTQKGSRVIGKLADSEVGFYIGNSTIDGVKRIYSYRALSEYPVVVIVGIAEEEALASFEQRRDTYYSIAALLSLVIFFGMGGGLLYLAERKQVEKEMSRVSRLSLIGEMAASIGHEIRNPMTTVSGFLQLMARKHSQDQEYYEIMIDEISRANSILGDYLLLAKDKMIDKSWININEVIENLSPLIKADGTNQGIFVVYELKSINPILVDEAEFHQLLLNLVRNGFDAMKPRQYLTIRTLQNNNDEVVLEIEDQGEGISAEHQAKIGNPFFTTKVTGTGLGLAVCYSICNRHGARISYESTKGRTVFSVTFHLERNHS